MQTSRWTLQPDFFDFVSPRITLRITCGAGLCFLFQNVMNGHNIGTMLQFLFCVPQIFEFSLVQKEYTEWSRKLQKQGMHPIWLQRDTPITHVTFNPQNPAHIILHDMFMFCILDKSLVCAQSFKQETICLSLHGKTTMRAFRFKNKDGDATEKSVFHYVSLFPHPAPPWGKNSALQSDDTEESPWAREDQTQTLLQDMQEL